MTARSHAIALATLCALVSGGAAVARCEPTSSAAAPQAPGPGAAAEKLFLVHLSLGPAWVADKPPQEQIQFREHGLNLGRLRGEGRIILGARYSDKGMLVLSSPTEEAARAEMAADPGVVAGIFTFELFEMHPFYDGCLTTPPRAPAP
jgi:hypothetical protein